MDTLTRSASLRERAAAWRKAGETVALIPTCGTLHQGHMSQYFQVREAADLGPIRPGTRDLVLLAAARLGDKRLIDSRRIRLIDRH